MTDPKASENTRDNEETTSAETAKKSKNANTAPPTPADSSPKKNSGLNKKIEMYETQLDLVTNFLEQIADGRFDSKLTLNNKNAKIKKLGTTIQRLVDGNRNLAQVASKIAVGNMDDLEFFQAIGDGAGKHCESDSLTPAVIDMMTSILEKTNVANEIANGNINAVISPRGHSDTLGHALVTLQFQIENVLSALEYLSEQTGDGQMLERLDVNMFEGYWAEIASAVNQSLDTLTGHFDQSPVPVVIVDCDQTILYANKKLFDILGTDADQVLEKRCCDLIGCEHTGKPNCLCKNAISNEKNESDEINAIGKNKQYIFHSIASPIRNRTGEVKGALLFLVDETLQREVFHQVSAATIEMEQMVEQLSVASIDAEQRTFSIEKRSTDILDVSNKLSLRLDGIRTATEQSQNNIGAVSTATEEMTSTVSEIAQSAEQARSVAGDAVFTVDIASKEVDELENAAKQISKVTETIVEIAEQTKLLALNATIEAARAGEAGKGFAVVASEVKELAQQTNVATTDIKTKIEAIQAATSRTIKEIRNISTVIGEVNEFVSTIATATEEQAITTRDISENLTQTTTGMSEVTASVKEVSMFASEMTKNIEQMNSDAAEIQKRSTQVKQIGEKLEKTEKSLGNAVLKLTS